MSKPIRDKNCECLIGTSLNRNDKKPFWTHYGKHTLEKIKSCRNGILAHDLYRHRIEIINLFGIVIGYLEYNENNVKGSALYYQPNKYSKELLNGKIFGIVVEPTIKRKLKVLEAQERVESRGGRFSKYIVVNDHKNARWFIISNKDVYCNECKSWHFKGIKHTYNKSANCR